MSFQVHRREGHVTMPWANGAGTTREVAKAASGETAFDWRLSFADVAASGPFSALPEVDRVITLVEGTSMTLDVDGDEHVLVPFEPYRFAGESAVDCSTDRPTVDFNVMTRRGRWTSAVESRALPGDVTVIDGAAPDAGGERFVAVLDGFPGVIGPRGVLIVLRPYDVVRAGTEQLTLCGTGHVVVVDLRPTPTPV
ncbi:hypothetical protein GCM10022237_18950 [Nocardioides ginsengisoli]|uniref:HutD family protein n=1 Tax=Nocardioides ginsengisoli TaxID=363868 RepID=A0ABW3W8G4_9ACTN